jgi:diadenylate cyclase
MIDILIVAVIIYELLLLTRHTRGSALLKGMLMILVIVLLSNLLGLVSLNWLLNAILQNGAVVLVILFQPELRKALERMGRSRVFKKGPRKSQDEERDTIISEIIQTIMDLSKRRVGALIVFERAVGLEERIETGVKIDGLVTDSLLLNIFEKDTPLHDGAVIIRGNRIIAASCLLPLTEARELSQELGTRHRAAIGISEQSDALVVVVSEETGTISVTRNGEIYRYLRREDVVDMLQSAIMQHHNVTFKQMIREKIDEFRNRGREDKDDKLPVKREGRHD